MPPTYKVAAMSWLVTGGAGYIGAHVVRALTDAGLDAVVTPVIGTTAQVAAWWTSPVAFLFLDGNHTDEVAQHDYAAFAPHVIEGGTLVIHDVFPDPADGGRPPYDVWLRATKSGAFEAVGEQGSLRVLRRTAKPIT